MMSRVLVLFFTTMVFIVLSMSHQALAFDLFPEFQTLTENEALLLDPVDRIDSEYQSDFITFITPLEWDPLFFAAPTGAFDFSVGSLSGEIFMERQRLRLQKRLLEGLDFRFTYFRRRDLDDDRTHAVLEMVKDIGGGWAVSLYGEPSHFKRENDFGVALLRRLDFGWNLRLFHTWVDITRGAHNDRDDRFNLGAEPRSIGFVARRFDLDGRWAETFFRWETPTEWEFPSRGVKYEYRRWAAGGSVRERIGSSPSFLNLRMQASRKIESVRALQGSTPSEDLGALDRRLIEVLGSVTHSLSSEDPAGQYHRRPIEIEPGLGWFHRQWRGDFDQWVEHRNLSPFVWLRFKGTKRRVGSAPQTLTTTSNSPNAESTADTGADSGGGSRMGATEPVSTERFDTLSLGYEVTIFTSEGTEPLKQPQLKAWKAEHRGNLRYAFSFASGAELLVALTADLDALFGSESGIFEGGNGMFRTTF